MVLKQVYSKLNGNTIAAVKVLITFAGSEKIVGSSKKQGVI